MLTTTLKTIFAQQLGKLKQEIAAYKSEEKIWYVEKAIPNSAGNLCLHLVGNLNTYIGAQFGKTGYVRHRDLEFSSKNIPRAQLLQMIEATANAVALGLGNLTETQLAEDYPEKVFAENTSTEYLMIHLVSHLTYHIGQINYHRRLLDEQE